MKPDKKLSVSDIFSLMRDHYEGTDFDMTKGVDAGPYGCPVRWRPMTWTVDDQEYAWERPISTQQTGFSFVSQSRSWLPDPIGGLLWYGVDDTYTSCYIPLYCGITDVPESFATGSLQKFSWESAWWVFNFVANYANLRYSHMAPEIISVQKEIEGDFLARQPSIEKTALELAKTDHELMIRFLTDYSVSHGEMVVRRWRELGEHLLTKYNDGYIKDENGRPQEQGYPADWLQAVVKSRPGQFRLKEKAEDVPETRLID
jgi:dipeptidase